MTVKNVVKTLQSKTVARMAGYRGLDSFSPGSGLSGCVVSGLVITAITAATLFPL